MNFKIQQKINLLMLKEHENTGMRNICKRVKIERRMYVNKENSLRTFIHKNTEPQHQLKGQEQYKNNRASKLEKIKNTEFQQKLSASY